MVLKDSFDSSDTILTLESSEAPLQRLGLPYELDPELFESKR